MMRIIPVKKFSSFTQEVTLDDVPYRLKLSWNTRGEYWSLIFRTREEEDILAIKLVLNYELISDYPDYGLPKGQLYVVDTTESNEPIGRNDFTNDRNLLLVYVPEEEVEAAV